MSAMPSKIETAAPETKEAVLQEFRVKTIQQAAARVIASEGLRGATMQAIAEEAGIAKGTIYLYFRDRRELLARTADFAFTQLLEQTSAILARREAFEPTLRRLVTTIFDFLEQRRDFFQLYRAIRYPDEVDPGDSREGRMQLSQYQSYLEQLTGFFAETAERGEIRVVDPERLALFVSEGINAVLIRRLRDAEPGPLDVDVAWIVDLVLGGVASPEVTT